MRILHCAESAMGGVGSYISNTVPDQTSRLGAGQVRVLAPLEHRAQLAAVGDDQVRTFHRPKRSVASLVALAEALMAECAAFKPDVIHAHSTFAGLIVRTTFAAVPRRPHIVYCPHGWAFDMSGPGWRNDGFAVLERRMARRCDRIVAISRFEAAQAHAVGIAPRRVKLVMSGVPEAPPGPAAAWPDARRKVLFVGRLDEQKGVDVLFSAIKDLGDSVAVRVAGVAVADEPGGASPPANVEMLGWLDAAGVAAQVRAADLVVIPSRWEGFGLVALEAMRAGKAVVASRVGGLQELVTDGVTGRLVASGDAASLGAALMADDAATLAAMGARGRELYLERFTSARMSSELLDVYEGVMRTPARVRLFPAGGARRRAWRTAA